MRTHNQQHHEHLVELVGVDMQDFEPSFQAMDKVLGKYGVDLQFSQDSILQSTTRGVLNEEEGQHLEGLIAQLEASVKRTSMNSKDAEVSSILMRHLRQTKESSESYERSFRDVQMANNLLSHLEDSPEKKGFFWAHNGHVCKLKYARNKRTKTVYWAGGRLLEKLGDSYFVILQDFMKGSFNAWHLRSQTLDKTNLDNYDRGPVAIGWESKKFFAYNHNTNSLNQPMTVDLLKPRKKCIQFHSVGAEYTPPNLAGSKGRGFIYVESYYYDCVLLIAESTPSHLLPK